MIILSRHPWLGLPRCSCAHHPCPQQPLPCRAWAFLSEREIFTILLDADAEIPVLYRQAWFSRCCDWLALVDLAMEVASPTRVRPGDESIIRRLRTICIERDRLEPISIDDPAEGASSVSLGWRALLVVGIEGWPRQPVRLVWYAWGPASLSQRLRNTAPTSGPDQCCGHLNLR
jgi:hypothetical protein